MPQPRLPELDTLDLQLLTLLEEDGRMALAGTLFVMDERLRPR